MGAATTTTTTATALRRLVLSARPCPQRLGSDELDKLYKLDGLEVGGLRTADCGLRAAGGRLRLQRGDAVLQGEGAHGHGQAQRAPSGPAQTRVVDASMTTSSSAAVQPQVCAPVPPLKECRASVNRWRSARWPLRSDDWQRRRPGRAGRWVRGPASGLLFCAQVGCGACCLALAWS